MAMRNRSFVSYVQSRIRFKAKFMLIVAMIGGSTPAGAQFGQLAPGGLHWSLSGVEDEIAVTFVMNPRFVSGVVPRGFALLTLAQAAQQDSAAGALLSAHPDWASYAIAIFSAALIDSTSFDDSRSSMRPGASALWWLPARRDSSVALDPRSRPGDQLIEMAFWSPDPEFTRRLRPIMPSMSSADVTMVRDDSSGVWLIRLQAAGASLSGRCRPRGEATPASYSIPQYSTIWTAGPMPGAFVVYTYYGHRIRPCDGNFRVTGSSKFAQAFEQGAILRIEEQGGWRARAAAYLPH